MASATSRRTRGHSEGNDLLYLFIFWIAIYISSVLAQKTRLSPLLFYLGFGALLINLHVIEHTPFLDIIAELAITLVFFALGFEENLSHFLGGIQKAWGIASIGALVPFGCGFGCALFFWPDLGVKPALMCGVAVTATAVSLTMITLKSEGLALSRAAIGIMTSAVLDDIAALFLVAILVPIATGDAEASVAGISWILAKALIFFACLVMLNGVVLPHGLVTMPIVKHVPILRSRGVHHLLRSQRGEQAVLITLGIGLGTGLVAKAFGFHPALGAYMAGLILEEGYFDLVSFEDLPDHATASEILNIYNHVKDIIENAAFCWLGPVFFLHLGAQIEISADVMKGVVLESLTIFIILFFGQVLSAGLAARYVPGGYTWMESLMIGFGTLGRAELFFVVLRICYIDNPIFSTEIFYSLTFAAMLLNISALITVSLFKPYYTGDRTCCVPCGSASGDGDTGPLAVTQLTWLHHKAMKSHRQLARRVYRVDTDLNLAPSVESCTEAPGVVHRVHRISTVNPSLEDGIKHNACIDTTVQQEISVQQAPTKAYAITGCGVKGCNRSTCVVCTQLNALLAQASARDNLKRLAYEDEKEDLAAMDHGRPTFDNQIQRTVSDPVSTHITSDTELEDGTHYARPSKVPSSATLSGATGHELAREIRKFLETHDEDVIEHTKSGVCAHGRSTSKERLMSEQKVIMSI